MFRFGLHRSLFGSLSLSLARSFSFSLSLSLSLCRSLFWASRTLCSGRGTTPPLQRIFPPPKPYLFPNPIQDDEPRGAVPRDVRPRQEAVARACPCNQINEYIIAINYYLFRFYIISVTNTITYFDSILLVLLILLS